MKTKKIISAIILLILVVWLAYYLYSNGSDFSQLSLVSPGLLAVLILLFVINYYLVGLVNDTLLRVYNLRLSHFETFGLAMTTGFYNLITPFRGGMAARAIYLKQRYKFAYVNFLASLSAIYILTFLVGSALGIIATLLIYFRTGIFSWILFLIFDAVFLGMLVIIFVSPKFKEFGEDSSHRHARPDGKDMSPTSPDRGRAGAEEKGELSSLHKWLNRFIKVINGWHLIKNNSRVIVVTSVVTLVQILISSLMLWLQFKVFGVDISFTAALFLSAIGSLSLVIGLTPGNLGVQEAIIVFSATTIGITPAESLSAALLGRAVSLVVLFVLGPIFSYVLLRNNKKGGKTKVPPTYPENYDTTHSARPRGVS